MRAVACLYECAFCVCMCVRLSVCVCICSVVIRIRVFSGDGFQSENRPQHEQLEFDVWGDKDAGPMSKSSVLHYEGTNVGSLRLHCSVTVSMGIWC
jgi:hypothetical protein